MAMTQQSQDAAQDEFATAFDNQPTDAKAMSEDEAFGLADEMPADDSGEGEAPLQTSTDEPAPVAEPAQVEAAPQEAQAALPVEAEPGEPVETPAEEAAEPAEEEAGEAQYAAAVAKISEDFGPEFLGDFQVVIGHLIKQALRGHQESTLNPLVQVVNDAIDQVEQAFQSQHFAAIREAHADFAEIVDSPEFGQWVMAMPEGEQAEIKRITESGSAREVISVLAAYKKSLEKSAGGDEFDAAIAGAEGVRSSGMQLPDEPPANDDYAKAWEQS